MVIIDGMSVWGFRTSISMDDKLFELFCLKIGSDKKARKWVRDLIKSDPKFNSGRVRFAIYDQVMDKELLKEFNKGN